MLLDIAADGASEPGSEASERGFVPGTRSEPRAKMSQDLSLRVDALPQIDIEPHRGPYKDVVS